MTIDLRLGDCLEILPTLADKGVDAVITDPPYGIGKAEWDDEFSNEWMGLASPLTGCIAVMPGTWNLLKMPESIDGLIYKWTLSAHLTNGMTRGAMGFGNWIPCVVYKRPLNGRAVAWCSDFSDWCRSNRVSRTDLNIATGTSDMGGWWASKLPHRCQVPTREQWAKIKAAFSVPDAFDALVDEADYRPIGDCKDFTIGGEPKPDHPSPKPINVMLWIVESLTNEGDTVLDPFMGSGTTGVACALLGRNFIGIEEEPKYYDIAARRIEEAQRQMVMPLMASIK